MSAWFTRLIAQGRRPLVRVAVVGGLGFLAWQALFSDLGSEGPWAFAQKLIGTPRLVSYDRLPGDDECAYEPTAAELPPRLGQIPLRAALLQQRGGGTAAPAATDPSEVTQRKPERMIRDPYAAYSAVAVDTANNEVVLTDENLFNIWVYDRSAKTPPNASTEPKRIIGGLNTKIEFQCGLYIDPANGDIYAVNNDTIDTLVIFSRKEIGGVVPDGELHTPHGTFGIAVDEEKQELFLTVQHDNAIVVYSKSAKGTEAPLRVVQGDDTGLADPHAMVLDTKRNLLYVTNHGSTHKVRPKEST